MTRQLPSRPNLEHLKAQAKDLLDAHRRGEPRAFERIRASVPAFARMKDDELARAPFALHDAQSAIAREYGLLSWAELRDKVAAVSAGPAESQATAEEIVKVVAALGWPPEAATEISAVVAQRDALMAAPTPASVPMIPLRNAVAFPGAVIPIDVTRPTSLPAIEAALATPNRFLAIFAQHERDIERPTQDQLVAKGSLCVVLYLHRGAPGTPNHVLLQGMRWITLDSIEQMDPYYRARVSDASGDVDPGDAQEIAALDGRLRDIARRFVHALPDHKIASRAEALAFVDQTKDIGRVADMAMAHSGGPVSESAAYTQETQLARRLERAIAALDAALARMTAATPPT
jgi:Lon protease-like protein